MRETQESISRWAEETFGPVGSNLSVAVRANQEMAELLMVLAVDERSPKAVEEAADVVIVLLRLADRLGATARIEPFLSASEFTAMEAAAEAHHRLAGAVYVMSTEADATYAYVYVRDAIQWCATVSVNLGADLGEAIDRKMEINRARQWRLDGNGHGYHVKGGAEHTCIAVPRTYTKKVKKLMDEAGWSGSAVCGICGKGLGWWCPESENHLCEYNTCGICIHCQQSEERK